MKKLEKIQIDQRKKRKKLSKIIQIKERLLLILERKIRMENQFFIRLIED